MRTYTQLTQALRYQISAMLKIGQTQTEISEVIGKHKSTISREVRRNRGHRILKNCSLNEVERFITIIQFEK